MSQTHRNPNTFALHDDSTSKLPSKSSQPPIVMAATKGGLWDYDSRVYFAKKYRTQLASAPAAFLSVVVGSPLENVKTRMQSRHFTNAIDCAKYTFRTEGIRGFWAGTATPLMSITISRVLGFTVYQKTKYALDTAIESATGESPLRIVNTPGTYPTLATVGCFTCAGAISGAVLAMVLTPFELIKNATQTSVLMASHGTSLKPDLGTVLVKNAGKINSWVACKQIIERRGFLGLWTGFQLHLVRDTVGTAIYFGVYETTKQALTTYSGAEKANTPLAVAVAGTACGIMSWGFTYPLDTMKTRAQNQLVGQQKLAESAMKSAAAAVARSSKWKGIEMIILRSSVQNMIQMSIFEGVKKRIITIPFSNGDTDLPKTRREPGRDKKLK